MRGSGGRHWGGVKGGGEGSRSASRADSTALLLLESSPDSEVEESELGYERPGRLTGCVHLMMVWAWL